MCVLYFTCGLVPGTSARFQVLYEWNYLNFTFPDKDSLMTAMSTGKYIPENSIISGIKYWDNYLYLTLPRMKQGVPATLCRIHAHTHNNDTEPLLEPFPTWAMNTEGDCEALQNVQNIEIDTSGKIWILDGGRTATMTKVPNTKCPPRLLIFDIINNRTVINYVFPPHITANGSFLYDLVVDEVDGGYAYITDNSGSDPGIIVYSLKQGRSWKVRDDATMRAQHDATEFHVSGTAISTPINIAGIALGPRTQGNETDQFVSTDRNVYFTPMSSYYLYSVSASQLRNERNPNISSKIRNLGRKSSQTDGILADANGTLYYGLLSDNSICKWESTKTPFTSGQKVIARDPTYIQWSDSFAIDDMGNLLVVTNKLQKYIYGQINLSEANFRILQSYIGVKSYLYGVPSEVPMEPKMETGSTTHETNEAHTFTTEPANTTNMDNEIKTSSNSSYLQCSISVFIMFLSILLLK